MLRTLHLPKRAAALLLLVSAFLPLSHINCHTKPDRPAAIASADSTREAPTIAAPRPDTAAPAPANPADDGRTLYAWDLAGTAPGWVWLAIAALFLWPLVLLPLQARFRGRIASFVIGVVIPVCAGGSAYGIWQLAHVGEPRIGGWLALLADGVLLAAGLVELVQHTVRGRASPGAA